MRKIAIVGAEPVSPEVTDRVRVRSPFRIVPILVIIGGLWWAKPVAIPVVVSLLISYALEPLVARLESWRLPRAFGVPLVLITVLLVISGGAYALRGEAIAFANRMPEAAHTIAQAVRTNSRNPGPFAKMQQAAKELEAAALAGRQLKTVDGIQPVRIEEPTFRWNAWLWQGSHGALILAGQLFAVVCLVYYLMIAGDAYKRKLVRVVGQSFSEKKLTVQILAEIDRQIERFLVARAAISGLIGVAVWITFHLLGLEEAGLWAVLSAILFTIPIIGPAAVIIGAGLTGVLQTGSIGTGLLAAGACTAIAAVEGNVLLPWLMCRVGSMNAVAVFVSLLFWGWLWGAWGLLLAVPITAAIKAVCERVDNLNPFAELLKE